MFSSIKKVIAHENSQYAFYDPNRVFVFTSEKDAQAFVDSFSTQVVLAKKKSPPAGMQSSATLNQALKKQFDSGQKKFKPLVARKSAMDAKVDIELSNYKTIQEIEAEIKAIDDQISLDQSNQEERLADKTKILHENIKYYGGKVQELISEIVSKQPYNQFTGEANTLKSTIKQLGIDQEKIKFSAENEEFEKF